MIKFRTVFDEKAVEQLSKHTLKKQSWIYIALSAIMILLGAFQIWEGDKSTGISFILFGVIFVPVFLIIVSVSQKKVNSTMTLLQGETVEIYEFSKEELIIQTSKGEEYFSLIKAKYGYLYRVDETKDYYFLYISKIQSHVIDKRFLIEGSIEELNELFLEKLGAKFKPYKK